ncbi:hypothetical protein HBH98_187680 [Parastagonospora nodorum]|nr:hypothetical protein HBI06_104990 [Parastagonospora nodorum]KAH4233958.1 hypothetical protein HBI05_158690 [Parastagonospora nodorum]KAH4340630.1 hypothetical protein HBH98_187680 [Parastagonospora nodorum]KAH4367503.1 hypothetical protein HBH97_159620 [Parastagonospora nodorum]KAH4386192.1 hypothetical protein HBH99_172490 [Parastagonospora nodorum]
MTSRCYALDGQPYANFDRYIPCNATAAANGENTACCAPGDNCLSNGMCQSQLDNKRKANIFWRNGCTDPTWNDPACPKHCEGLDGPLTHGIYYCLSKDSYCCPTGPMNTNTIINTTCCNQPDLTFNAPDPVVYTIAQMNIVSTAMVSAQGIATTASGSIPTSAVPSSSSALTAFADPSSSPSSSTIPFAPSASPASSSSSDNNIGVKVGVPLGIALAIALAVIAWLVLKLRRKNASHYAYRGHGGLPETGMAANGQYPTQVKAYEVESPAAEAPNGDYMRAELGTGK